MPNPSRTCLMRRVAAFVLLVGPMAELPGQTRFPGTAWERVPSPETAGWDGEKLRAAFAYGDSLGSAAVMLVQGGRIVAEWGPTDRTTSSRSGRAS